jgi:hypothetical protein
MIELVTEVAIEAPRPAVWDILADWARYGEWNPYVRAISGSMKVGALLSVTVSPPGGMSRTFHPVVTRVEPNQAFAWAWAMWRPALFIGEHIFELEDQPDKRTRLVHREEFSGLLTPLHRLSRFEVTRRGFEAMNQALSRRAAA